jgi:THUMP domain-like
LDLSLLKPEIQTFININIGTTIAKLALQKNPFPETDWITILNQIEAKSKAKTKLPTWFATKNILFPSKISVEQTSSEKTAIYKSSIVSGTSLIDLSGGFGVDDYFFSKKVKKITHCEINPELSQIVKYNFQELKAKNISCENGDSFEILAKSNQKWDWIYVDPSRRNDTKGKVFMLKDCLPNVPENLDFYFQNSNSILIKTAPLLDIAAGLLELKNVKTIHIVALENEVKELLWELQKDFNGNCTIKTVNILKEEMVTFDFVLNENSKSPNHRLPEKYLYEPNSAIMKSGGFDEVGLAFSLNKLHKHSHLYTSNQLQNFPGRVFEIQKTISYTKSDMKQFLETKTANITTRNFPETVEKIRKKWKIKDGGNQYCFFTTDANDNKIVLICKKL